MAQVGRMLVGGIYVCGLYAVSNEVGRTAVETLQRLWPAASTLSSLALVHVCAQTSQFTVRAGPPKVGGDVRSPCPYDAFL